MAQPVNPYYEKSKALIDGIDFSTPIISAYGQQDNQIRESGNEIFGANTSPEVAEKVRDSRLFRSSVDKGRDLANASQQEINAKNAGYMSLGGATAPITYNPGGTTVTKSPFDWGGLATSAIGGGASIASAGMAPGA